MAEPKKKLSKTRTNLRRSQYKIDLGAAVLCSNCKKPTLPHHVCQHCGFYNGQAIREQAPTKRIVLDEEK